MTADRRKTRSLKGQNAENLSGMGDSSSSPPSFHPDQICAALENDPNPFVLYDSDLRYRHVNQACLDYLGYTEEQVLGKTNEECVPEFVYRQFLPLLEKARRTGQPQTGDAELPKPDRSGTIHLQWRYIPIFDDGGGVSHVLTLTHDVTVLKATELMLRERQALLDSVFSATPAGIGTCKNRILSMANQRFLDMVGYSLDEVNGKDVRMFYADEQEYTQAGKALYPPLEQRPSSTVEARLKRKNGEVFDALISAANLQKGHPEEGITFVVMDITERKHQQEQVQRLAMQLRETLESISDAFFSLDDELNVTYFNAAAERILGRNSQEVLGRYLFDAFPEARGSIFETNYRKAIRTRESIFFESYFEPYDQWYDVRVYPRTAGISVYFQVITDRKRSEKALRESEEKFRRLFNAGNDAVLVHLMRDNRLPGRFTDVNDQACRMTGYSRQELIQMTPADLERNEPELLRQRGREIIRDGRGLFETSIVTKNGQTVPVEISVQSFQRDGQWMNLAIVRDISARKQAEAERESLQAQIQHTQKLESLGVLAGGIAHDFNNLLMGVLGNADLALTELSPVSPARESVESIKTAAGRAAELCRQMLAYSGKGRFVVEPINLSEVVDEMAHMLEVSVSKKAILKYHFADNLPQVMADATQMRQVIMNLITNASEAIGDRSGVISVTTGAMDCDSQYLDETYLDDELDEGMYVTLEVADTGCGMDKDTRHRLFEPFFTTKFTGRGLGLAAVLGIVRGHNGAIKVYSEPGQGTTFRVLLPACEPAEEPEHAAEPPVMTENPCGTILLADDEETIRTVAKRMLERFGCTVYTAEHGQQAIDLYRQRYEEIDVVILDLTMPHMDGEEAYRKLRQIDPDVRVIVSSGYNEQEVAQRFIGKGLSGFIQKPYRLDTLQQTLRQALSDRNS